MTTEKSDTGTDVEHELSSHHREMEVIDRWDRMFERSEHNADSYLARQRRRWHRDCSSRWCFARSPLWKADATHTPSTGTRVSPIATRSRVTPLSDLRRYLAVVRATMPSNSRWVLIRVTSVKTRPST